MAFSPDGKLLAGGHPGIITLWDVSGLNPSWGDSNPFKRTLGNRSGEYTANEIVFSPDSNLLASAHADQMVRLWNVKTGELQAAFKGHTDEVNSVSFSPSGKILASASDDLTIRLWDIETGKIEKILRCNTESVTSVSRAIAL